jgi:amino acid adenylation domain-containing protein
VDLRAQIADRKAEIIEVLNSATTFSPPPISRRSVKDPAPLSFAQERLWFLEQLEPDSAVYNICRASRLTGDLNIPALDASLSEIVRRHEVLRSAFQVIDGRPLQVTLAAPKVALSLIDLRGRSAGDREDEVQRWIKEEAARPFDLCAGLFLRGSLLRVGDDEHILILTTHHIVSDAWSMGILTRELWWLYEAYAAGKTITLKDLPIQYADFASWQREWLQGEMLESQLSYWKKQLHDIPILNLPTDRTRPARQSFHGARLPITLPESLTSAINELSHRQSVTPFMILLAAFHLLLHRYSGQDDVVVGSPIANRSRTALESLIGFFVNTLVLRADLSGNPSFSELLLRIRDICLDAHAHQDLPFEKLVQELQVERDLSRNPLFQVMFVLQNATRPFTEFTGLRVEPIEIDANRSPFDLSLFLRERHGRFIGYFEYSMDLFERETIERMAGHFERLLEGIVADPNQLIATLPILTEAERHQILIEWNDTVADYPKDKCIHHLFEAQGEITPNAIALEFQDRQITYRELDQKANQLAHYLISLSIGPDKLVGICVERSIEMVVGLLGILKAGGAYVPLDPGYPKERLRFMLEDSQVSVLLTQEKLVKDRGWKPVLSPSAAALRVNSVEGMEDGDPRSSILDPQLQVVFLDRDLALIEQQCSENLTTQVGSDNLAYFIYTSGSTGRPKGVAIEHRNTVALLHWAKSVFTSQELAGVLASTSICFDLSVFELFLPLCSGGKVILVDNVLHLHSAPERDQVTLINTVPSAMIELLRIGDLPDSVRTVNLAGEPLQTELVNKIYAYGTVERVYDLYGPSETTTYSTFTLRTRDGQATIGRPISNTRVYILDGSLQSVPIGVQGELYIGGTGVARGYLNRPQLTAERFIQNPFNNEERLYRTGDLARYLLDGNVEFLGRADNQVKIRGYRIELGEIEAALNQHPAVNDSVVVTRARESLAEKSLIGYIVPHQQPTPSIVELRNYLKEKLPEYMIPSMFVILDELPLTPNGKIDRQALPPPDDARPQVEGMYVEPRTQVEELLAQIWREVLKLDTVGVHDNFFELGGYSLLAIQIISRVREAFEKAVPLLGLFEAPTVAGLAATIEKTISGRSNELPLITRVTRDGPLPLSMNQEHLWRLDQMIPDTHFFNMPYVYRLRGELNVEALEKALKEIVQRHEALRTVFDVVDGGPVQVVRDGSEFHLVEIDLRRESANRLSQRAAKLIFEERERPFHLATGPLFRTVLLRLTVSESLLLITMHHIISDYWSMQLFRQELGALYQAFSEGRWSPLESPVVQYADYAVWERQILSLGLLDKQLSYWKRNLAPPLPRLLFSNKHKRMKRRKAYGNESKRFELGGTLFESLKSKASKQNCTPFMFFMAALNILLHSLTGQEDIRVATIVSNRSFPQSHRTIGNFANTVILRTQVSDDLSIEETIKRVREVVVAAQLNQEIPFEFLARTLERQMSWKPGPLSSVIVMYDRSAFQSSTLAGITLAPLNSQEPIQHAAPVLTTYDVTLRVKELLTKLTVTVNCRTEIGGPRIAARMTLSLTRLLVAILSNADQRTVGSMIAGITSRNKWHVRSHDFAVKS